MADIPCPAGTTPWDEDEILTSHNIEDIFPELGDEDYHENWEKTKTSKRQAVNISKSTKDETEKKGQLSEKRVHDKIVFDKSPEVNKKSSVFDRIGQVKDSKELKITADKLDDNSSSKKSVFERIGKAQMQINEISSTEDTGKKRSVFDRIGSTSTHENEISSSLGNTDGTKRRSVDYVTHLKTSLKSELNRTRAGDIKGKYYEKAVAIWSRFSNIKIPDMEDLPEVRVYKNKGVIVSFDMPDEYIDNFHPLWGTEKDLVDGVHKGIYKPAQIPRFIHSKWGWRNEIDLRRNLSHFSKILKTPVSFKSGEDKKEPAARLRVRDIGDLNKGINVLQNMMTALKGCDSSKEVAGIDIWNKIQRGALQQPKVPESSPLEEETTRQNKFRTPLEQPQHDDASGSKRKREDSDDEDRSAKKRRLSLDNFEDEVVDFTCREKYKFNDRRPWVQRQMVNDSAGLISSARESFEFNSFYVAGEASDLTEEKSKEMLSLESTYQSMMSCYASPYASGKHNLGR